MTLSVEIKSYMLEVYETSGRSSRIVADLVEQKFSLRPDRKTINYVWKSNGLELAPWGGKRDVPQKRHSSITTAQRHDPRIKYLRARHSKRAHT